MTSTSATGPSRTGIALATATSDPSTTVDESLQDELQFKPHLDAIRASVRAGFRFQHLPSAENVTALQAFRVSPPVIDMYLVRDAEDAFAARMRLDDLDSSDPPAVWHERGSVEDVVMQLLELPASSARSPLVTASRRPSDWSGLWVPG